MKPQWDTDQQVNSINKVWKIYSSRKFQHLFSLNFLLKKKEKKMRFWSSSFDPSLNEGSIHSFLALKLRTLLMLSNRNSSLYQVRCILYSRNILAQRGQWNLTGSVEQKLAKLWSKNMKPGPDLTKGLLNGHSTWFLLLPETKARFQQPQNIKIITIKRESRP